MSLLVNGHSICNQEKRLYVSVMDWFIYGCEIIVEVRQVVHLCMRLDHVCFLTESEACDGRYWAILLKTPLFDVLAMS